MTRKILQPSAVLEDAEAAGVVEVAMDSMGVVEVANALWLT